MKFSQLLDRVLIVVLLLALLGPSTTVSVAAPETALAGGGSADSLPGSVELGAHSRIAVDAGGNTYVVGTSGGVWGVSPVRAYAGGADVFVARLSAAGALQWLTFLGGASEDAGYDIAVSGSSVYVVGTSYAAWGTSPLRGFSGLNDAFVAKLNASNGALAWHTFLGGASDDFGCDLAVDGGGSLYVAGTSLGAWGSPLQAHGGLFDAFAARLNSSGALQWNTFLGGAGIDTASGIAVDANAGGSHVYLAGSSTDAWGTTPVSAYTALWDAFAVELDSSGARLWHTFLGGDGQDQSYAVTASADGSRIYIAGASSGAWGAPLRGYSAWWDGFAARLDGGGARQWNTFLGSGWSDMARALALDSGGNLYLLGDGDDAWGTPTQAYLWGYEAHLAKLSANGALQQLTFLGGWGDDFGGGLALGAGDVLYLSGSSDQEWGSPVAAYGDTPDVFAAKYTAAGARQWNTFLNGNPWSVSLPFLMRP